MDTFSSLSLQNIKIRFDEVRIILQLAEKEEANSKIFSCLCRSSLLLLVAHFEGTLKDIISSTLDDINKYGSFSTSSIYLKRTFCNYFLPSQDKKSESHEKNVKKLLETLDPLDPKFLKEAFLFKENKNPKSVVIDSFASRFGVKNFFKYIDSSKLDIVFEGSKQEIKELKENLYSDLVDSVKEFPYKINLENYCFNQSEVSKNSKTFWETFVEELLKNRHLVAHGTEMGNVLSLYELEETIYKVEILCFAFALIIFYHSKPIID